MADEHKTADQHEHNTPVVSLRFNNGIKWKAESTNNKVKARNTIVEQFAGTEKTRVVYNQHGTILQAGLGKMINKYIFILHFLSNENKCQY